MLLHWCEWLGATAWSIALRESDWVYPLIETAHVLALCVFLGLALMLDLRLLGLTLRRTPVSAIVKQVMPWTWLGFAVMVISGLLLFYSDPMKFYGNLFFRIKLLLLVLAGLNAWLFHATVYARVDEWDAFALPPLRARLAGGASLLLWAGIVTTGRFIAYKWF